MEALSSTTHEEQEQTVELGKERFELFAYLRHFFPDTTVWKETHRINKAHERPCGNIPGTKFTTKSCVVRGTEEDKNEDDDNDSETPEHKHTHCACGEPILYPHYICDIERPERIVVVGSRCIDKFKITAACIECKCDLPSGYQKNKNHFLCPACISTLKDECIHLELLCKNDEQVDWCNSEWPEFQNFFHTDIRSYLHAMKEVPECNRRYSVQKITKLNRAMLDLKSELRQAQLFSKVTFFDESTCEPHFTIVPRAKICKDFWTYRMQLDAFETEQLMQLEQKRIADKEDAKRLERIRADMEEQARRLERKRKADAEEAEQEKRIAGRARRNLLIHALRTHVQTSRVFSFTKISGQWAVVGPAPSTRDQLVYVRKKDTFEPCRLNECVDSAQNAWRFSNARDVPTRTGTVLFDVDDAENTLSMRFPSRMPDEFISSFKRAVPVMWSKHTNAWSIMDYSVSEADHILRFFDAQNMLIQFV